MRKQLLCGVAAIAIAVALGGNSFAADMPVKVVRPAPTEIPLTWAGWYLGGHLGYGSSKFHTMADITDPSRGDINNKPRGVVGGMQAGYNWQHNSFVFGLEADVSATGWNQSTFFGTTGRTINNSVSLLASLRGRLGISFGRTLFYGTGGVAYAKAKLTAHSPGGTIAANGNINKWGVVFGGGAEWRQSRHLSFRAEGLWYQFNKSRNFGTDHIWLNRFKNAWVGRVGMNYHW